MFLIFIILFDWSFLVINTYTVNPLWWKNNVLATVYVNRLFISLLVWFGLYVLKNVVLDFFWVHYPNLYFNIYDVWAHLIRAFLGTISMFGPYLLFHVQRVLSVTLLDYFFLNTAKVEGLCGVQSCYNMSLFILLLYTCICFHFPMHFHAID